MPSRLADPAWATTPHRAHCLVAALSERAARERAAGTLTRCSLAAPAPPDDRYQQGRDGTETGPLSPWLQPRLVEILEAPGVTATSLVETFGAGAVLVPSDPGSPMAEYRAFGVTAPPPAASAPQAGPGEQAADKAKVGRRKRPAAPATVRRRAASKAAKTAPAKRAAVGRRSAAAAKKPAGKKVAKPVAKGSNRRSSPSKGKRPGTAARRPPAPARKATARRSR